ncbi:MAG: DUF1735 and LamG domain-containing protein [Alistipes sp.]|nr:DUF1735 and LamG domain-containing protein [Alistipes sp.]
MKYNKCLLVLSALAAVVFTGCKNDDPDKHHFDNKFYISSALMSDDLLIKSDTPGYTKTIESRLSMPAEQPVAVTIEAVPAEVAAYNMIYGDNAVVLPAECYELSSNEINIAAGQVAGETIEIEFKDINTLDGSQRYVLPVTVTSCKGVGLLDSRTTVYFVARQGAMINVVANIAYMYFPVNWSAEARPLISGMKQVTVEALLRSADWTDGRGDPLSSVFGIEGNFLVRIGDADRPRDQLQLATGAANGGNWPAANAAPGLPVNEWVHIAVVWDAINGERIYYQNGVQVAYSNQAMSGSVTLTGDCYVGKSYNDERYIPGEISELRVWSVARTADEIANNIYGVNPESEGLVAYWKFNEGVGSSIADHANGTNLSAVGGTPTWVPVTLPEIK